MSYSWKSCCTTYARSMESCKSDYITESNGPNVTAFKTNSLEMQLLSGIFKFDMGRFMDRGLCRPAELYLVLPPFSPQSTPRPMHVTFFNAKEDKTPNTLCFPDMEMVLGYCHGLDTGPPGICTVAEPTSGPLSKSRASMTVDVLRLLNTLTVCSNLRLIKGALIYP